MPIKFKLMVDGDREMELFANNRDEVLDELLEHLGHKLVEEITPTTVNGVEYTKREHIQFIEDMEGEQDVYLYRGRGMWRGPAVNVDNVSEVQRLTSVPLQWDSMGLGMVVYPVEGDYSLRNAHEEYDEDDGE